jgi:UDP-N-acetylglucosamine 2-epimerase (non-hydrolysing)
LAEQTSARGIIAIEPLSYIQFLSLNMGARVVFTDSGGLQEETTVLGIPCITIRENTERPVTVTDGTNRLAGTEPVGIRAATEAALSRTDWEARRPELWDGHASERIAKILLNLAP